MSARRPPLPVPEDPPSGTPFEREFWSSPLRGPWLTTVLGSSLLPLIVVAALTGFLSHAAYDPNPSGSGQFNLYLFSWPAGPTYLYVVTQGLHVIAGLAAIPILFAKLWSVIPKLFEWPPVRSLAHGVERLALALLVGGALFVLFTGVLNIQIAFLWSFSFLDAHYYASFVFLAGLGLHLVVKAPIIFRAYRENGVLRPLKDDVAHTVPEPLLSRDAMAAAAPTSEEHTTVAPAPGPATVSRRGLLGLVGAGSLGLAIMAAGPVIGGPLRSLGLLSPRGRGVGTGPNDFQVNKTLAAAGLTEKDLGPDWRLTLTAGDREVELSRDQLLAMPQRTETLPIACVEGWSTTEDWTGVSIRDLARMALGTDAPAEVFVESFQKTGGFTSTTLSENKVMNPRALLALKVNGVDLSPDHGFPARIIVPALPGVRNIKWVDRMTVMPAAV
ncbi:MAG: molybdopterin-dependent oxidoreductase [Thermoleophilaceae bacterium]